MIRAALLTAAVLGLGACATTGGSNGTPRIMDPSVNADVRQAATCYLFNGDAGVYLSGVQLGMRDYAGDAAFWLARFERLEPDAAQRGRLVQSGRQRLDEDYTRAPAVPDPNTQRFNMDFAAMTNGCAEIRQTLEAGQSSGPVEGSE